jgi:ABC-2 type transport system ATP-binding protein
MTRPALRLARLHKRYRKRVALDGLDLQVPAGTIMGLVGSNGAGKTTCLLAAAGIVRPNSGIVDVLGEGPFDPAVHSGRVALMPQDTSLPPHAVVRELLLYYGRLQGLSRREAAASVDDVLGWCHLADRGRCVVRTLSHGMRRRVLIAQAFVGRPELILLDEPMSGLDPREVASVRRILVSRRGRQAIMISSHNLAEIERVCDRIAFIEKGRTVRADRTEEVTGKQQVLRFRVSREASIDALETCLPTAAFETDVSETGSLWIVCRYDGSTASPEQVNATVLKCLLDSGVGILEVRRGAGLEEAYMSQWKGDSA